jgi:predicted DNA-binding antitoxin AbrB/MazE fold protein
MARGAMTMSIELEATYENGVLKLDRPLPLADQQRVRVTVHENVSRAKRSYGLLRWTGDPKDLERLAMDPELGIEESP